MATRSFDADATVKGFLLAIDPFLDPLRDDARRDRVMAAIGVA